MKNFHFFIKTVARRKKSIANLILIIGTGQIQLNDYCIIDEFFVKFPNRILIIQRPFRIIRCPIFDAKIILDGRGQS